MVSYEKDDYKNIRNRTFLNNNISFSPTNNKNIVFFPIEEKKEEIKFKNIDLIGIYKSASITFYSKNLGYLLCQEIRDNKLVYHPIGGKYEERDGSIEYTACREFIEETGILKNKDFINLVDEENKAIDFIYDILANDKVTNYYDFYVNIEKEYIHKYYIVNMDKLDLKIIEIIKNIDSFYINTFKENSNNGEYIVGLYWDKEFTTQNLNKKNYSMLTIYLSNLLKKM